MPGFRLVQTGGFTPSDAAHVLGLQDNWPGPAAELAAKLMVRFRDMKLGDAARVEGFCREVWSETVRRTARVILDTAFGKSFGEHELVDAVSSGRGKLGADMREIWMMQPRFEKRVGSTPFGLVEQPRFRAGFDFLRLRADVQEIDERLADWWQEFSLADDATREDLVQQARTEQQAQPRAPRVRRVSRSGEGTAAPAVDNAEPGDEALEGAAETGAAPKKRRRRRRKPSGDAPPPAEG